MIVLNDIHIGTQRQAGTTPLSQIQLKEYIQASFSKMVDDAAEHIIINGDLFDGFSVDPGEVIGVYETLAKHCANGASLTLGMGNHDSSAKGDKTSSFHLLAFMLKSAFPGNVSVVDHKDGLTKVDQSKNAWMIPHMLNQSLFDLEIEKAAAMKVENGYLLLHCNVMSPFAEHSDHSLNLSEEQVDALVEAGWTMVVGHEHQCRYVHGKRVIVTGNQIPTSISDCLNNPANKKQRIRITDEGWIMEDVLDLNPIFTEVRWTDLDSPSLDGKLFIRVTGDCSSDQSSEMVNAVAKLRQKSKAFVVSSAVKIEGVAQMEGLADLSMESINKFDVLHALLEELTEQEQEVIKELLV